MWVTSSGVRFKLVLCQGDYCMCYVYVNNINVNFVRPMAALFLTHVEGCKTTMSPTINIIPVPLFSNVTFNTDS